MCFIAKLMSDVLSSNRCLRNHKTKAGIIVLLVERIPNFFRCFQKILKNYLNQKCMNLMQLFSRILKLFLKEIMELFCLTKRLSKLGLILMVY